MLEILFRKVQIKNISKQKYLEEQVKYLRYSYYLLQKDWENMKPSKITIENREKFEEKLNYMAEGDHYQEMINMFRRLKVQNGSFANKDDSILSNLWLENHIEKVVTNTQEQALFEPPAENMNGQ